MSTTISRGEVERLSETRTGCYDGNESDVVPVIFDRDAFLNKNCVYCLKSVSAQMIQLTKLLQICDVLLESIEKQTAFQSIEQLSASCSSSLGFIFNLICLVQGAKASISTVSPELLGKPHVAPVKRILGKACGECQQPIEFQIYQLNKLLHFVTDFRENLFHQFKSASSAPMTSREKNI